MSRLAVAVIEGEESRIRESLEGEEGEGGGAEPRMGEKEKRVGGQKNRSRSHGLGTAEQMDSQDPWQSE